MDQIKHLWRDLSLRKSIILYVSVFTVIAIALCAVTSGLCSRAQQKISDSYPTIGEKYYLTNLDGERLGEGTYISKRVTPFSKADERWFALLDIAPIVAAPVYSALCILAAALLFYRNKLKEPLAKLKNASEKISENDLDFSIEYDSQDELGQLCASFETMRAALAENFAEMWRQVEDRRQLNAAFAHDLRTPLTVLRGYNEMLQASEQQQTRETAATMEKHLLRMEAYVSSMSRLRRLEDTQPDRRPVSLQPLIASLKESARIVCVQSGKVLHLQNQTSVPQISMPQTSVPQTSMLQTSVPQTSVPQTSVPQTSVPQLSLDTEFVSQVCNNLIANAVRYARTSVTLSFTLLDNGLLLSVSDDGKGFGKDILHRAANPYFTEEADRSEHFGLGLYICKLLCEHHGGSLAIGNNSSGGAEVSAYFKSPVL